MSLNSNTPGFRPAQAKPNTPEIDAANLEAALSRATDEWEWIWRIREKHPELRDDPVWRSLQIHLAHRADLAWQAVQDNQRTSGDDE